MNSQKNKLLYNDPDTIEGLPVTEIEGKMVDFKKLFSLHLPDTVTKIGPHAFENCDLEELELPDGLEEIGEFAFAGNDLSSISLGSSLKSIGNGAFAGNHITEINVDRKNKYYTVEDGRLFNADKTELLLTEFLYTGVKFIVLDELFGNPNTIDRGLSDIKTVSYDVDFETGTFCDIILFAVSMLRNANDTIIMSPVFLGDNCPLKEL